MLHIGIIGLGAIGQRLIKQFSIHQDVEIIAICDTNEQLVQSTSETLQKVKGYTNYEELLSNPEVNLVYVAVPPKFHYQIVMDAISKKKHVLCEKPLANSIEEAKEMYEAASKAGIIHAMNFPLNYGGAALKFEELINQNYIGSLRRLQLSMHFPDWPRAWQKNNWVGGREQGGFVLEVGVHFIQQILKIFGDVQNIETKIELPKDLEKSETGIIATAELLDGTPILIEGMSQTVGKEYIGFIAYGTEGTLALENWGELRGGKLGEELKPISFEGTASSSLIGELVKAIKGEKAEIYDFEVGYKAQEVLEGLRKK